jgi:energy-coupling factor transporter ATP-binding protein EcfA2
MELSMLHGLAGEMKVAYLGRASRRNNAPPSLPGDVVELLADNWDDYSYKTYFPVVCRVGDQVLELGSLRLLVGNVHTTSTHLNQLLSEGWDGKFPIPKSDYISVPADIAFYEQLDGVIGNQRTIEVAKLLRDASYLVRIVEDEAAKALVDTAGFRMSLQRERGSVKAYLDVWRILEREAIAVLDLGFRFNDVLGGNSTLNLNYQSESRLPHDINVLIGPNGSGKSQLLHQMVRDWISPSENKHTGFVAKPNLSQVIVVSYSPFERFPVDLAGKKLQDTDAYHYFGFRGRSSPKAEGKLGRIVVSHAFPRKHTALALLSSVRDDKKFRIIRDWGRKVETAERVLRTAFDFDYVGVEVRAPERVDYFYHDTDDYAPLSIGIEDQGIARRFIPIHSHLIDELNINELEKMLIPLSGVTFFKDEQPLELSSGQRLFAYVVLNVLGAIRRNILLLIDEPELFLHPTLEIQFIDMLKSILSRFNSKALLATHSVVTVREVPADCVHVFERTADGIKLRRLWKTRPI